MKKLLFAIVPVSLGSWSLALVPGARAADQYVNAVLADHPVAYYRMNEASGTTAVDAIAAQNGGYVGGLTLGSAGPQPSNFPGFESTNTEATFDGVDDYLIVRAITNLSATAYSYELWFNDTHDGGLHYLGGRFAPGSASGDFLFVYPGLYFFDGVASSGGTAVTPGWHQVALTRNGSVVKVYYDGALAFSATSTAQYGTANEFVVGARGDLGLTHFKGWLDELSIYNSALTAEQVAAHYAAAVSKKGN